VPHASQLRVGSKLVWQWKSGAATTLGDFGDPVSTDSYALCVYGEFVTQPRTLLRATVAAGPQWRAVDAKGFRYKNTQGTPVGGVTGITLKPGVTGKASIKVKAERLALPLALPVTVQLRTRDQCWGAGFPQDATKKNNSVVFLGKSSPSGAFLDAE
jgi:hypothetical protein